MAHIRAFRLLPIVLCLVPMLAGCDMFRIKQDIWRMERNVEIQGSVTGAKKGKPVAVLLVRDHWGKKTIKNYYVRYGPGTYRLGMTPGTAYLFAFEDQNEDLRYQKGEPAAWYGGISPKKISLKDGEKADGVDIRLTRNIPKGTDDVVPPEKPTEEKIKLGRYKISRGEVTNLDDKRFTQEKGKQGLWQPVHFAILNGFGIYFLEPYDPRKIPVLFVHGAGGYPQEFRAIIERLDRKRFQPWVYHYPSGVRMDKASDFMVKALTELHAKHKYRRLFIVAHSMGGLVSRAAINEIVGQYSNHFIRLFVSFSTPWDGVGTARMGVDHSPVVIPAWIDMVPDSPFLQSLFAKELPPSVPFYLFFGVVGGNGTDGAVPLTSELSLHAQGDAKRIYGFPENHTSILRSEAAIGRLNYILMRRAK